MHNTHLRCGASLPKSVCVRAVAIMTDLVCWVPCGASHGVGPFCQRALSLTTIGSCSQAVTAPPRGAGAAAGAAAGVPVVGMLTSQTAERLTKAGAVRCVRNYTELLALAGGAHGAEPAAG